MNETELCQSLMSAIAGTPCPVTCGTAAIHPTQLVLLWDDRPQTNWLMLDAAASEFGVVLTTASIERGPHGRVMTGAILRPREGELDAVAASLRIRYVRATSPMEPKSAAAAAPNATQRRAEPGHTIRQPRKHSRSRHTRGTSSS